MTPDAEATPCSQVPEGGYGRCHPHFASKMLGFQGVMYIDTQI